MLHDYHIKKIHAVSDDITVLIDEDVEKVIPDVDILIAGKFDKTLLEKAGNLKWIHALAAGVDRLLFPEFIQSDILLTNSSGVHSIPISEHVLGMMLMFSRALDQSLRSQMRSQWERPQPTELHGKTVGIVGFGSIGEQVGAVCKCMGTRVIALKNTTNYETEFADLILPPESLGTLLSQSDFVVLTLPLTEKTRHLITREHLRLMKPTAYLINVSRGEIVSEADLIDALTDHWIKGAGLDVFEEEPLSENSPLWKMDSVIITPHYAGSTPSYFDRAIDIFCENLHRFLIGATLMNVVDKKRGY
ncbi:MAG: D-2-hydroxyacid dehydrogenase [Theionarchaea archaeon]|nr:D-2-hydroxyacid dehydrogenase [Theionarchaea archaeon]MBU7036764.1 D-2-hydroxyacid dehydrogenase [Theionarchaea archaeon]